MSKLLTLANTSQSHTNYTLLIMLYRGFIVRFPSHSGQISQPSYVSRLRHRGSQSSNRAFSFFSAKCRNSSMGSWRGEEIIIVAIPWSIWSSWRGSKSVHGETCGYVFLLQNSGNAQEMTEKERTILAISLWNTCKKTRSNCGVTCHTSWDKELAKHGKA